MKVNAGGDGLDSNGDLTISGGIIYVSGPTNSGNGALDYNGTGSITGGTLIAAGSMGMAQSLTPNGNQGVILLNLSSVQSGGTIVTVEDEKGNVICSFTPEKYYQSLVISAPELENGGTYTIRCGSVSETVTLSSLSYSNGGGMMGGFGGGQGGPGQGGFGGGQGGPGQGGFGGGPGGGRGGWS